MVQKEEKSKLQGFFMFMIMVANIGIFVIVLMLLTILKETNANMVEISEKLQNSVTVKTLNQENELSPQSDDSVVDETNDSSDEEDSSDDEEGENEFEATENEAEFTSKALYSEYVEDEEEASEKYQDKKISVSGKFEEATETDSGKVKIILTAGEGTLACLSLKDDENTAEIVEKEIGDLNEIIIEGTVDGFYEDEIELETCQVIYE